MTHPVTSTQSDSLDPLRALAQQMIHLQDSEWMMLGVSQDFHQRILLSFFTQINHLKTDESELTSPHHIPTEAILSDIEQSLTGTVKRLFKLTASTHVEQLVVGQWFMLEDRSLTLHINRLSELQRRVYRDDAGDIRVHKESPASPIKTSDSSESVGQTSEAQEMTEPTQSQLNYVDPLNHISSAIESPFTIRRLDQIITYLDGVVLPREQVGEQLNIPIAKRDLIFDATNRLGLTHQEGDYLKLDFLGVRIARMSRDERLKTLAMMASRLRSEAKLQQTRERSTSS